MPSAKTNGFREQSLRKTFGEQDDEFGAGHADILMWGLSWEKRQTLPEVVPFQKNWVAKLKEEPRP